MAPPAGGSTSVTATTAASIAGSAAAAAAQHDQWVTVTWMPHTALAPNSYVGLCLKSAHRAGGAQNDNDFLGQGNRSRCTSRSRGNDDRGGEDDWRVRVGVYAVGGLLLVPVLCHTPAAPLEPRTKDHSLRPTVTKATHDCQWNYYLKLPIRWRDLPRDAYLLLEVLNDRGEVARVSTLPLFSQYGKLVTGLQRLELTLPVGDDDDEEEERPPDQHHRRYHRNPGVVALQDKSQNEGNPELESDPVWEACLILDELDRAQERARNPVKTGDASHFGQIPSVPWLDALTRARAEAIIAESLAEPVDPFLLEDTPKAYLIVELPMFEIPIMHEESFYPTPHHGASGAVTPLDLATFRARSASALAQESFDPLQLVTFLDYENEHDNPVEDKYRTLAHDLFRGLVDPALKPDRSQRDRLASIIDSTSHHLSREEKDLLWRFRFSLVDNRRALTKFLLAVDWTVDGEVVQAAELLEQWRKRSPIQVTDALKLLGKHVAFQTNLVRSYAIDTLAAAPDSELRLYLLQLVQALKYENADPDSTPPTPRSALNHGPNVPPVSSLAHFLVNRAAQNMDLANFLYWYLKVELDNPTHGARYKDVFATLQAKLSESPFELPSDLARPAAGDASAHKSLKSIVDSVSSKITTPFRSDHGNDKEKAAAVAAKSKPRTMWDVLVAQDAFMSGLLEIQKNCRDSRGKKDQKEEELRNQLTQGGYKSVVSGSIPLPSAPEMYIHGVNPDTAKIFKSALYPALLDFNVDFSLKTEPSGVVPSSYKVIVKTGDDLRQDQLVIMMIQLMDGLLKRAALDLCLTPYSILATSPHSGLVEFVEGSAPISQILADHNGSILQFFQLNAPQAGAKLDVRPEVLSTYVRSLAGYCVITYLLGVGDRHLDNVMLRSTGHFFHIDFGFIFGRDPKPLPPAFRLTREMVEGMGGTESSDYRLFCSLACQAFNALRKSAGLVLNLLHLMSDSGVEDLSSNPSFDAEGVIAKVEERFRLDLTDEQAERWFVGLINNCLAALAPRVMDVIHWVAVSRR